MKQRHAIPMEKCERSLIDFYENVAAICGITATEKDIFDCRKVCVTKAVQECLIDHYLKTYPNVSREQVLQQLLLCGPKANLEGDGYEFEAEDGFVHKGE